MKRLSFKISSLAVAATLILGGAGCAKIKDFGDTNVNPQVTSSPITAALLTNVLANISAFASQSQPGYYCQYFAEGQYPSVSIYNAQPQDFSGNYNGLLYDLQNIIINNTDAKTAAGASQYGSNNNQIAVAKILKSYIFWHITDRWGDIPYSKSLQGVTPGYDKQEDIYKGIITELKGAVAQFDGGNGPLGDIIYSGNVAKWKKFANSLRMLLALRLSKQYPNAGQYAATEFVAAASDAAGHITDNADNFVVTFPGGAFSNPWEVLFRARRDVNVAKTYTDLLTGLGDPRIGMQGSANVGTPYGALISAPPTPCDTVMSIQYRQPNSPINVLTASVVLLAKAEAVERGWYSVGTAQSYYDAGVTASLSQWGYGASAATYVASGAVNYTSGTGVASLNIGGTTPGSNANTAGSTSAEKLKRIALQRYIALYPDGAQGWAEWRRSAFPNITPTSNAINTSKQIPRRLLYGQTEYSTNPTGVAQGVATLSGGDTQDSRVWWDKP